ncbi:MAG: dihydroorotase [Acidimicrobiia bacterium]
MSVDRVIAGADVFIDGRLRPLDILVDQGRIAGIVDRSASVTLEAREVVDANGLTAIPGCIDVHVHTREPGYTHKEDIATCTQAAAAGGITTIFGMPNLDPPTMTRQDLQQVLALYAEKSFVDYNHNPAAKLLDELQPMAEMGIAAYKIYMVVDTGRSYPHPSAIGVQDHGELYRVMRIVANLGLRLMVHPHDQSIMNVIEQEYLSTGDRSPEAYAKTLAAHDGLIWDTAVATLLRLAEATGCPLHLVHTQTRQSIDMIRRAKARGVDVSCEVNHWTLFLARWEDILEQGPYVLSYWVPDDAREAVWEGINDGTIDMLASDHAPHTREEKDIGYQDMWAAHTGTPGIQYQVPLLLDAVSKAQLSFERLVEMTSMAPARIFGLRHKGSLAPSSDADIALVDRNYTWTIKNDSVLSKIGWTPYDGRECRGNVARTLVRGADVWAKGDIVGMAGRGKHVRPSRGAGQ